NHYAFISPSEEVIESLKQVETGQSTALENDPDFQRTQNQWPRSTWIKGYLDPSRMEFPQSPAADYLLSSMSHVADHALFSLNSKSDGLHFNTAVSLADSTGERRVIEATSPLQDMARYAPADSTAFFAAGPQL